MIKKNILLILLLTFVFVAIEFLAYLFFTVLKKDILFSNPDFYLLTDSEIQKYRINFDPLLGWDAPQARPASFLAPQTKAWIFGDSFVYSAEVQDDETWGYFLAKRWNQNVINYGIAAYGVDQALLKFERISITEKRVPPFVILGFTAGNIVRSLNIYRKFLYPYEGGPHMTKPRFNLQANGLQLIPNPISNRDDLSKLKDPVFVEKLMDLDAIHSNIFFPVLSFPYILTFFKQNVWDQDRLIFPFSRREHLPLLKNFLLRFSLLVHQNKSCPVIVFFPEQDEISNFKNGDLTYSAEVESICKEEQLNCLFPLKWLVNVPNRLFTSGGHYSKDTNLLIAEFLALNISEVKCFDRIRR